MPPSEAGSKDRDEAAAKRRTFFSRLLSTVLLWGLVAVAMIFANVWLFLALVLFIVVSSVLEYFGMIHDEGMRPWRNLVVIFSPIYIGGLFWLGQGSGVDAMAELDSLAVAAITGLVFLPQLWRPLEGQQTLLRIIASLFGFLYLPFLFGFVVKILYLPGLTESGAIKGHYYALYLIAVTKFTDMGAYLVGSLIGKHKMIPHISPKKTWEGIGGAFLFAGIASFGLVALLGDRLSMIDWTHAAILTVLLGAAAVVGDLAESILKRSWETKDSGHVLPGIGGTLDLVDSICFTAPVLYFYLRFLS